MFDGLPLNPLRGTIMVGINQRGWSLVCICTLRADRMQARLPMMTDNVGIQYFNGTVSTLCRDCARKPFSWAWGSAYNK
jgi:hypothetical protein